MGIQYQYKRLDNHSFTGHSLDDFVRRQTVTECWRKIDNDWKLVPNVYEENWSQAQCREIAEDVVHHINLDQTGFGAFDGERIIGFATVSHRIFGAVLDHDTTAGIQMFLICYNSSLSAGEEDDISKTNIMLCGTKIHTAVCRSEFHALACEGGISNFNYFV